MFYFVNEDVTAPLVNEGFFGFSWVAKSVVAQIRRDMFDDWDSVKVAYTAAIHGAKTQAHITELRRDLRGAIPTLEKRAVNTDSKSCAKYVVWLKANAKNMIDEQAKKIKAEEKK